LFALIAVAVKLESRGPVLFGQRRVGKDGRLFRVYKFRTMQARTPAYALAPRARADARVTQVGRLLRRWSLDELPQLWNVLTGDMSLVGPRPEMPFLVREYQPWQRRRLLVRPGITGLWQVVGRKELPLHRNVEYDLYYVRHRGWVLDATILLRTIPAVLFRRGAY
jgi:lipopolysaccharide/colanic/teichoic acid biosynthesis glycosyltransferase